MANRIQGITVEIGGDTKKLQTVLKGVNSEIKNTQSQYDALQREIMKQRMHLKTWNDRQRNLYRPAENSSNRKKIQTVGASIESAGKKIH